MTSVILNPQLSPAAHQLLLRLRDRNADCPGRAIPDHELAALTNIPQRDIIDVHGELIEAGFLALACGQGRYIARLDGNLHQAEKYCEDLHKRSAKIHARAHKLKANIEAAKRMQRPADSRGQMNLGIEVQQPSRRFAR